MRNNNFRKLKKYLYKSQKINPLFLFVILTILLFILFFIFKYLGIYKTLFLQNKLLESFHDKNNLFKEEYISNQEKVININDSLNLQLISSAYIIYNLTQEKVVLEKDSNITMPIASVSKLMTVYVGLKYCPEVLKKHKNSILINSSNQESDELAIQCLDGDINSFVMYMNREAKDNNLNMYFQNPNGLDIVDGIEASNYSDAISVAKLLKLIYDYDAGATLMISTHSYSDVGIANTNINVNNWPFIIGSKTGYTDIALGNLATLYQMYDDDLIAIVVLGSSKQGRFTDTEKILDLYLSQ